MLYNILTIVVLSFIGSLFIGIITNSIRKLNNSNFENNPLAIVKFTYGVIEISMFSFSIMVETPEFIFVWIGVKTALKWDRIHPEKSDPNSKNNNINVDFYSTIYGMILSVLFSYIIACVATESIISFK